jgi:hypothetical protein
MNQIKKLIKEIMFGIKESNRYFINISQHPKF